MTSRILKNKLKRYHKAASALLKKRNEAEQYLIKFKETRENPERFNEYYMVCGKFHACDEQIDKVVREKKDLLLRWYYV